MKDEIKEILEYLKKPNAADCYVDDKLLDYEQVQLLLDYITNLQEQLHQASLDIQELIEKDIGCPSWCDKLTNLQEENERLLKKSYKDDVIITKVKEILETLKGSARWERHLYEVDYLLNIVNGGDE